MTRRTLAVAALLLLAACNRGPTADAPDADADLRAKTAAKTVADLAAADAAAKRPLPRVVREQLPEAAPRDEAAQPEPDLPEGNTAD